MTTELLTQLKSALEHRLHVVADHALRERNAQAHLEALKNAAAALESVCAQLPDSTDPQLRHFLERQSYTKALHWLTERRI